MSARKFMMISTFIGLFLFVSNCFADEGETGSITVNTIPDGLNVYIDGKVVGKTPLKTFKVSVGNRIVSVETEPCFKNVLFYSWNRSVYVEKDHDAYVEIVPEPILTNLTVEGIKVGDAKVEDTQVYVDGKNVGVQPGTFEVPVCSKLLEVAGNDGSKVIYSSELDLLKGKIAQRNERNYALSASVEEKSDSDKNGKMTSKFTVNNNKGNISSFNTPDKKHVKIFGPYKWIGTSFILAGAVSAGLGGFFDYKAVKEFDKYDDMGDRETIKELIEAGTFDEDAYISERDSHYDKGKDYAIARTVLYAAGGAMFVTGVVLLFIPEKEKKENNAAFFVIPSTNGMSISAEIHF